MLGYVPFLLILFIIAAVLRVDFFFTIAYLFAGVYLLAHLWTRHTTGHLQARRRFEDHAFCGDWISGEVVVHNTSRLPIPWLEVCETLPVDLIAPPFHREVISLGSREQGRFAYTLDCRKRGYYPIGPLLLETGDLLGIIKHRQLEVEAQYLIVYPRIVPLQQLGLPTRSPLVALPAGTPLFEDPTRIMGVRDYRRGDSPRRIHWTATASAGRLLVKQYQPSIARETLILLDLDEGNYTQRRRYVASELAIVAAASIANHIIVHEGLPAGLAAEGWDPLLEDKAHFFLPPRSERAHLIGLLEVLARAQVTPTTPFAELLRRESVKLSWGATLVIITGRESEPLIDTLVCLKRTGFAVTLVLVHPEHLSAELRQRSDLLGIPVHRVWTESDLEAFI